MLPPPSGCSLCRKLGAAAGAAGVGLFALPELGAAAGAAAAVKMLAVREVGAAASAAAVGLLAVPNLGAAAGAPPSGCSLCLRPAPRRALPPPSGCSLCRSSRGCPAVLGAHLSIVVLSHATTVRRISLGSCPLELGSPAQDLGHSCPRSWAGLPEILGSSDPPRPEQLGSLPETSGS